MQVKSKAGKSLIFYTGKNFAGTQQAVTHGTVGEMAASTANWMYQSVAMADMQSFIFSTVNTAVRSTA